MLARIRYSIIANYENPLDSSSSYGEKCIFAEFPARFARFRFTL